MTAGVMGVLGPLGIWEILILGTICGIPTIAVIAVGVIVVMNKEKKDD